MGLLFGVIGVVTIVLFFLVAMIIYFSDEITAYLKAKTEEINAMTELIKKVNEHGEHS